MLNGDFEATVAADWEEWKRHLWCELIYSARGAFGLVAKAEDKDKRLLGVRRCARKFRKDRIECLGCIWNLLWSWLVASGRIEQVNRDPCVVGEGHDGLYNPGDPGA